MLRSLVGSEMCIRDSFEIISAAYAAGVQEALKLMEDLNLDVDEYRLYMCQPHELEWLMWIAHEYKIRRELQLHEQRERRRREEEDSHRAVSYTHLTLPTKRIV
eukprot:TRINITY_DN10308_c0_g1_i1.p2 TRINITY_DN10308_c0_g1~~TRINITY_DN10308_c0_g1_i1.p2  ORF type:complete len:104 (-),score=32.61 TRINITY_DN10308_c0_g1_i1:83-394(-)